MNRRRFIEGSLAALAVPALRSALADEPPPAASNGGSLQARIGPGRAFPRLHGDTWTTAWADDGDLYAVADDCFGLKSDPINSNLAIFRIMGSPKEGLRVATVNPMASYGKLTSLLEDGASWKGSGITCVDGVLYLAVSRHLYMDEPYGWIQQSWDASIIKSQDHGRTWSTAPTLGHSMFPGRQFSNPYFVQHGQDGKGGPAGSEAYVYATSNDGYWNNGNAMTLGRVRRERLAALDPRDWEFVHRLDKAGDPTWGPRHDSAIATFHNPGRTSMTGIQYVAALDQYLMAQWYYPDLGNAVPAERWKRTQFELYRSSKPWGPWNRFHEQEFYPQGYYNPGIVGKFLEPGGPQGWIIASGDFFPSSDGNPYYTINTLPLTLSGGS